MLRPTIIVYISMPAFAPAASLCRLGACSSCIIYHPTQATYKRAPPLIVYRDMSLNISTKRGRNSNKYKRTHLVRFLLVSLGAEVATGVATRI